MAKTNKPTRTLSSRKPPSKQPPTTFPQRASDSAFTASKRDKRIIRHSLLMSKVHFSGISKPQAKRRRPGKKLVANLDSLGDALQDVAVVENGGKGAGQGVLKNVRSGRGERKRKERVVRAEKEAFGRNLAVLSGVGGVGEGEVAGGGRLRRLREHILKGSAKPAE